MGYIEMFIVALIFSFGGTLIKLSKLAVSTEIITWFRFSIGLVILYIYMKARKMKIRWHMFLPMIWVGAFGKSLHYLAENYGVARGFSYGNILVGPVQTVVIVLVAVFWSHEKISRQNLLSIIMCMAGVFLISWNGTPLEAYMGENAWLLLVFVIAGIGSAIFTLVQKKLLPLMPPAEANLSMFLIATVITLIPIPISGSVTGVVPWLSVLGLVMLGAITGISFLLIADAMRTVPLYAISLIQSSSVIFSLIWAVLFFHEVITVYIILGTLLFTGGMLVMKR